TTISLSVANREAGLQPGKAAPRSIIAATKSKPEAESVTEAAVSQKAKDTLGTRLQPRRMASSRHEETRLKPHVQKSSRRGKKPRCSSTKALATLTLNRVKHPLAEMSNWSSFESCTMKA